MGTDDPSGAGDGYPTAYMTFAASMGMYAEEDVPRLCAKLMQLKKVCGGLRSVRSGEFEE